MKKIITSVPLLEAEERGFFNLSPQEVSEKIITAGLIERMENPAFSMGVGYKVFYTKPRRCPECDEQLETHWSYCPECGESTDTPSPRFFETDKEAQKVAGENKNAKVEEVLLVKAWETKLPKEGLF